MYVSIAFYVIGLVAVMGGILASGRRVWRLALRGAICALLGSMVAPGMVMRGPPLPTGTCYATGWIQVAMLGIRLSIPAMSAIVLTVLSREEFR